MATYKVWLTVKDRYGGIKKVDGGTIDVGLNALDAEEIKAIDAHFATDTALSDVVESGVDKIRYAGFDLEDSEEGFGGF